MNTTDKLAAERAAFEEALVKGGWCKKAPARNAEGAYITDVFDSAWFAWQARAALEAGAKPAPAEPVGWKLVPVEPTPEMIEAGDEVEDLYKRGTPKTWGKVYRAMLAAAPAAPAEPVAFDAEGFRAWVKRELPDDTVISNGTWWAEHLTKRAQRFVKAAPAAPAPHPDTKDAERYRKWRREFSWALPSTGLGISRLLVALADARTEQEIDATIDAAIAD